jgi:hypothetical protein
MSFETVCQAMAPWMAWAGGEQGADWLKMFFRGRSGAR